MPKGKANLGSISKGTLRAYDLNNRFWGALYELDEDLAMKFAQERPFFFCWDPGEMVYIGGGNEEEQFSATEYARRLIEDGVGFVFMPDKDEDRAGKFIFITEYTGPDSRDEIWQTSEVGEMIAEDYQTIFEKFCPPFCYFGVSEGDGSDFGFWFSKENLQEAESDGTACQVPDGFEWKVETKGYHSDETWHKVVVQIGERELKNAPKGWPASGWSPIKNGQGWIVAMEKSFHDPGLEYVFTVNDHGNVTIFNLEGQEVLAVV